MSALSIAQSIEPDEEREERELCKEYLEANERLEHQKLIDLLTLGKEGATKNVQLNWRGRMRK